MRSLATVTVAEEGRSTRTRTSESCAGFSVGGRSRCCTPAEFNHHRNFVPSLTAWSSTADTRSRAGPIPSSASISESFGTLHFQPVPPSKRFLSMDSAGGLFSRDQAACPGPAVHVLDNDARAAPSLSLPVAISWSETCPPRTAGVSPIPVSALPLNP